jgi:hypothetical protein
MKNVMGSVLAFVTALSLASAPVFANPQDPAKSGKVEKTEAKKKEPTKPKGPATTQGQAPGQPGDKPATPEG